MITTQVDKSTEVEHILLDGSHVAIGTRVGYRICCPLRAFDQNQSGFNWSANRIRNVRAKNCVVATVSCIKYIMMLASSELGYRLDLSQVEFAPEAFIKLSKVIFLASNAKITLNPPIICEPPYINTAIRTFVARGIKVLGFGSIENCSCCGKNLAFADEHYLSIGMQSVTLAQDCFDAANRSFIAFAICNARLAVKLPRGVMGIIARCLVT